MRQQIHNENLRIEYNYTMANETMIKTLYKIHTNSMDVRSINILNASKRYDLTSSLLIAYYKAKRDE